MASIVEARDPYTGGRIATLGGFYNIDLNNNTNKQSS